MEQSFPHIRKPVRNRRIGNNGLLRGPSNYNEYGFLQKREVITPPIRNNGSNLLGLRKESQRTMLIPSAPPKHVIEEGDLQRGIDASLQNKKINVRINGALPMTPPRPAKYNRSLIKMPVASAPPRPVNLNEQLRRQEEQNFQRGINASLGKINPFEGAGKRRSTRSSKSKKSTKKTRSKSKSKKH
jgi:hypothetical protein